MMSNEKMFTPTTKAYKNEGKFLYFILCENNYVITFMF